MSIRRVKRKSIDQAFADDAIIGKALEQGIRAALLRHKQMGKPIAIWRNGKVVWVPADQIEIEEPPKAVNGAANPETPKQ